MKETQMIDALALQKRPLSHRILLKHWSDLFAQDGVPFRNAFNPSAITGALEHSFILDMDAHLPRFRLAGPILCDALGMDLRGMPATALVAHKSRKQYLDLLSQVVRSPSIISISFTGASDQSAEALFLPLRDDARRLSRIVGAWSFTPSQIETPRLELSAYHCQPISNRSEMISLAKTLWAQPAHLGYENSLQDHHGFASFEIISGSRQKKTKPRGQLRLV